MTKSDEQDWSVLVGFAAIMMVLMIVVLWIGSIPKGTTAPQYQTHPAYERQSPIRRTVDGEEARRRNVGD